MKVLSFLVALSVTLGANAQSTLPLRADSVIVQKIGGNGELIIENGSRSLKGGVLYNRGNGRTAFKNSVALNDTTIVVGGDTILVRGGGRAWLLTGNSGTDSTVNFIGTTNSRPIIFKVNNVESFRVASDGSIGVGVINPAFRFQVNSDISINGHYIGRGTGNDATNFIYNTAGIPSNTTGNLLTINGYATGAANTTGFGNTYYGAQNSVSNMVGNQRTTIGWQGAFFSTGHRIVTLGSQAGSFLTTEDDKLVIHNTNEGATIYGDMATRQLQFCNTVTNPTLTASAAVEIVSTTRGFLMPRMTSVQRVAISSPATGLQVFDTDSLKVATFDGTIWQFGVSSSAVQQNLVTTNLSGSANRTHNFNGYTQRWDSIPSFTLRGRPSSFNSLLTASATGAGSNIRAITANDSSTNGGYALYGYSVNGIGAFGYGKEFGVNGSVGAESIGVSGAAGVHGYSSDNRTSPGLKSSVLGTLANPNDTLSALDLYRSPRTFMTVSGVKMRFFNVKTTGGFNYPNILSHTIESTVSNMNGANFTTDLTITGVKDSIEAAYLKIIGGGQVQLNQYNGTVHNTTDSTLKALVVGADGKLYSRTNEYKRYNALITQSSTGAPTGVVLGLNTIGAIVWTRNSTGDYTGTLSGAFTVSKTFILTGTPNDADNGIVRVYRGDANTIRIKKYDFTGGSSTDGITDLSIEIRVYP